MPPLRRHQLAHLSADGWSGVLSRDWDAVARECLQHWAQRHLPLVVTRQPAGPDDSLVALGLPAPLAWDRRRIALQLPSSAITWLDEFPGAAHVLRLLSGRARSRVQTLLEGLSSPARVYGGYGWQLISGERYVHADSDLDLWIAVESEAQADAVAATLQSRAPERPRVDGEIIFTDGAAVAWREWVTWRAGRTRGLLVKRLQGASIEHDHAPQTAMEACAT